jgi:uncharacterized protein (TIGR01777 family)
VLETDARTAGKMRILISGSSGMVGSAVLPALAAAGHETGRLARPGAAAAPSDVAWDPAASRIDAAGLGRYDAVIHLAGENIAAGRWSEARKKAIRRSRVDGTLLLTRALAKLERRPRTFVCASAIGYYGDRGDEILKETSPRGRGFLPAVCVAWESAAEPAEEAGLRVVHLRFGIILSKNGGALARMLLPFRLGLGGPVGDGRQYMSWITLDDAVGAILHALDSADIAGPVNAVSPSPVTNREFGRALGRVLRRPAVAPLPAFAARLAFGEMADALLLASARVVPGVLQATGYPFRHPNLEPALRHLLDA